MHIHEFIDEGLGHSSYVIDLGDGSAALVDPPRFPTDHERLVDHRGLRLAWTIDTHSHADYVTGSPGVVQRRGAVFIAPAASHLATPHRPVVDGENLQLAPGVELIPIATPGHTPDHHAYLLTDHGIPEALFSGGSLMVGAVGRTDLCGPDLAEPLAHEMFRGLHRFDDLPDSVVLYPTHGAGSFCSAPGSTDRTSSLGAERRTNPLLGITDEDGFVRQLLEGFGTFPSYFARLPELNRLGPTRYDLIPTLADLTPDEVERRIASGAVVVDGRPIDEFAAGHLPNSLSNSLRSAFASWIGWLVEPGRPIILVLDDDQSRDDAVRQCLDVGQENLVGALAGGVDAWRDSGRDVHRIDLVGPDHLGDVVIDVRQADEYATGHVPGARNTELGAVATVALEPRPVTVMCGHGERAMSAASILAARGFEVDVLAGGPDDWAETSGQDLESGR
jgi:hydroxyacylglutathione hydrolase